MFQENKGLEWKRTQGITGAASTDNTRCGRGGNGILLSGTLASVISEITAGTGDGV